MSIAFNNNRKVTPGSGACPNPGLSVALRHDYEALYNDVHQANALADDFQKNEAGKHSEIAVLKKIFENAQSDLARLCTSIADLRQERHVLANEAMRAMALERKVTDLSADRERLRVEREVLRQALSTSAEELARKKESSDTQITRMAKELDALRQYHLNNRTPAGEPDIRSHLSQIAAKLEHLTAIVERQPPTAAQSQTATTPCAREVVEDKIDISFDA